MLRFYSTKSRSVLAQTQLKVSKKKRKKKKDLKITHKTILKTTCFYMVTKTFTLKFTKGAGGAHVSCPISSVSKWSYKSYLYLILLFMMLLF